MTRDTSRPHRTLNGNASSRGIDSPAATRAGPTVDDGNFEGHAVDHTIQQHFSFPTPTEGCWARLVGAECELGRLSPARIALKNSFRAERLFRRPASLEMDLREAGRFFLARQFS
ncbi:MAG: hypothetical protein B6D36_00495 [Planctomycetes bacterium UTPLA1]|nr:MAG: hypothetical protein B6D36_00495 [Planctomycetes bacterium UTPLA1]